MYGYDASSALGLRAGFGHFGYEIPDICPPWPWPRPWPGPWPRPWPGPWPFDGGSAVVSGPDAMFEIANASAVIISALTMGQIAGQDKAGVGAAKAAHSYVMEFLDDWCPTHPKKFPPRPKWMIEGLATQLDRFGSGLSGSMRDRINEVTLNLGQRARQM
ncbi:MAG: hypothetical protein KF902_00985 [Phycisphaeraceae bacterium]|nr:hypothetical protein [Phycisphaeraceae bacterium]MBX3361391.1 hypothetical protein [Phycisphaeraceae bacterium]MCW5767828.1 hypothetical protein [Phycisphaeraceae bacterium]